VLDDPAWTAAENPERLAAYRPVVTRM